MTNWTMGIHTQKKNRMWVDFPYDPYVKDTLKRSVAGARWDADGKVWHFPLDIQVARDIRRVANSLNCGLTIRPDLADWARAEKARIANLARPDDMTADQSTMLPNVRQQAPWLIEAMTGKPWQIPGASFVASQRNVLIADQPGLGKTLQVISAIVENNITGPILVVAPKSAVAVTWPEELEQWLKGFEQVIKITGEMTPEERRVSVAMLPQLSSFGGRQWVLIGPDYLRIRADIDDYGNFKRDEKGNKIIRAVNHTIPELFMIKWSAVIVDESHIALAAGSPGVGRRKWSAQRLGLSALKIDTNGMKIAMSGTPSRGKTDYMFGTLQWLDPPKYTSYWNWVKRHYGVSENMAQFGPSIIKGDKILNEKRFFTELRPYMVRRTKREVAPWLPPKTYGGTHLDIKNPNSPVAVWLPMTKRQKTQYEKVVKHAVLMLDEMGDSINVNGILAEMVRLKQVANSAMGNDVKPVMPSNKIDWIIDFVSERISAGTKTIVASQFTQFIELLSAVLGSKRIKHYVFTGKTNNAERARIKQEFQRPEGEMLILLNTKSGGVSLTLDAADDVVICDQTWTPDDQEQVEDRAHRISRNHKVTIWNLASIGTIDEDIAIINAQREEAIVNILDAQRGVSYVKQLVNATKARMNGKEKKSA